MYPQRRAGKIEARNLLAQKRRATSEEPGDIDKGQKPAKAPSWVCSVLRVLCSALVSEIKSHCVVPIGLKITV